MKKKILLLFCFTILTLMQFAEAQTPILFGLTSAFGPDSLGSIFKIDARGNFSTIKKFPNNNDPNPVGDQPNGSLLQASNGKLYGMTYYGGDQTNGNFPEGPGVIFSLDPITNAYQVIFEFNGDNGAHPFGNVMEATNNKLYGMTSEGGSAGLGVLFSINLDGTGYTDLVDFDGSNGFFPQGSLMQASNGLLYGTTGGNQSEIYGTLFNYDISSSSFNQLWAFDGTDPANGAYPLGNVIEVNNELYGLTRSGGDFNQGVIFTIDLDGSNYANLVSFQGGACDGIGGNPTGSLVFANDKLFGTTSSGGNAMNPKKCILEIGLGTVFSYQIGDGDVTYLHKFSFDGEDGIQPQGDLLFASDGLLYGMTVQGGEAGGGIIFSLSPDGDGSDYTKVYDFDNGGVAGAAPLGNLIEFIPPAGPTIAVNTPSAFCAGGSGTTLTASCSANCTGITYSWVPSTGLNTTAGVSVTANPSSTTTYTVTAINASGGTASATSVVTVNPLPVVPVTSTATGITTTQFTAHWGVASNATAYFLDVSTGNTFSSFVSGYNNLNVGNVTSVNVIGLSAATIYYYRIRANNTCGTSNNSNFTQVTTSTSGGGCSPVGGTVSLPFSIICDGGTQALSVSNSAGNNYIWQISSDNATWSNISGATTTSYTTSSSDGHSTKYYRLLSQSTACWNVASTTAEVDISTSPINITTTSLTDNSLALNWGPIGSGNYNISYNGASSGTALGVTPPKTLTGLTANGNYTITISQTGAGLSGCPASGTTSVTTLCAAPPVVNIIGTGTSSITLSWSGGAGNYRVYFRPLYAYNGYFTRDVINGTSTTLTIQGGTQLYHSVTYEIFVSKLDCPAPGSVGQPSAKVYATTTPALACTAPVIDNVQSICPVQIEVTMHGSPTNQYYIDVERLTPTIQPVTSYPVTGSYFTMNVSAGQNYLITARSICGGAVSNMTLYPNALQIKPQCSNISNLVISNPTCNGFTASWNADQCIANNASYYQLFMRQVGTLNWNAYGVTIPTFPIGPYKVVSWQGRGKTYDVYARAVYSCNGYVTYGATTQTLRITTLSAGCREEASETEEAKPLSQQTSMDNSEVFSLYPNPNAGNFTLDLSRVNVQEDAVRIEVTNMMGQTVLTHLTSISDGHMSEFINMPAGAVAGTYILRLTAGKNVYTTKMNLSK